MTTINAKSCSYDDVNYAVNTQASSGDTVIVPSGTATWTNTLDITKSVKLKGAGIDLTNIINNGNYYIISIIPSIPSDNPIVEVSGFTFDGGVSGSVILIRNENTTFDFTRFRIYMNKFQNVAYGLSAIYSRGMVFGLIDNNNFTNNFYDLNIRGYDWHSWDKYTKDTDNTLVYSNLGMGGARFLYVENNTFSETSRFIISSGEGARWVFRFNTLTEDYVQGFLDIHGDTNNDGNVAVEIYGNTQTTTAGTNNYGGSMWIDYRGGTSIIYNNSVVVDPGGCRAVIKIREETSPCSTLRKGYDMRIHNGYIWNNKNSQNNDNMCQWHHAPLTNNDPGNCLSVGVDYWSDIQDDAKTASSYFTIGLSSARVAVCSATIPADVYWETDTNKLYRCTSTNHWEFIYTPYTYPHPLAIEESCPQVIASFDLKVI